MAAVLVDIGGTHLRIALWRDLHTPELLHRSRIRNFTDGNGNPGIWDSIIATICDVTTGVRHDVPAVAPIILSFPGPITNDRQILNAPTVSGKDELIPHLQPILSERTGREVHILNDLSAAAWHVNRCIEVTRFMVVTVSSGIGSKIFDRNHGRGVIDDVPYAGEIGHLTVDDTSDAPPCDCGGRGHLGAVSSGRGIERYARRLLGSAALTNEQHVVPLARAGDTQMLDGIRHCTRPLARILLQATIAAGLERIVVIGGFALSLGEIYRSILQQQITQQCDYRVAANGIRDLIVMGDEDSCLLGAAAYAARFQ